MQKYSIEFSILNNNTQYFNAPILQYSNTLILQYFNYFDTSILQILQYSKYFNTSTSILNKIQPLFSNKHRGLSELPLGTPTNYNTLTDLLTKSYHSYQKKKKKNKNLNTTN